MTLILARASEHFVTQAADRLVTTAVGTEFDAKSNKNIVYACADGIVSISYTGIAFLGNIPTDQWLVEQITGVKFDRNRKPAAIGLGQNWEPTEGLGQTMLRIESALRESVKSIPIQWKGEWGKQPFDLLFVGWHWNKRARVRPIIGTVSKACGADDFHVGYHNRLWHYKTSRGIPFILCAFPISNYPQSDLEKLNALVSNRTWTEVEAVMVEEIRRISDSNARVGKHVLTVTLSPPNVARGIVTDHPIKPIVHPIRSSFVPDLKAEVHLTPWLLGKNCIQPPALLSHTQEVQLGQYLLTLSGPNKPGVMFMGSLQRPALR
jgi:hypothetical protein